MRSALLQDFALGISLDCQLLRTEVNSGQPLEQNEILSLAAMAEALYISATLESRSIDDVRKCAELWASVSELFSQLCSAWIDIPTDEPSIIWLRGRLEHFRSLCFDRQSLYDISAEERTKYCQRKADEGWHQETSFAKRGELSKAITRTELAEF